MGTPMQQTNRKDISRMSVASFFRPWLHSTATRLAITGEITVHTASTRRMSFWAWS